MPHLLYSTLFITYIALSSGCQERAEASAPVGEPTAGQCAVDLSVSGMM